MIKLIASDIDGTLLNHSIRSISPRMFEIIETLHQKGIVFVAASGRQYPNLYRLFQPVSKHMAFICENGGFVIYKDQIISSSPMDRALSIELMKDIWNREGCEILLSGKNTSYLLPKSEDYVSHMRDFVKNNVTVINDLETVNEDFLKISVYEKAGIVDHSGDYFINKWQDHFKCTISGRAWLDFVAPHVNKGSAIKVLMDKLSLNPSQAMAFGDNYNDIEMLSLVKYGYVMDNAVEDIRTRFSYHSNKVEESLIEAFDFLK